MTTQNHNPARRAAKVAQLAVKNARQAVSAASRGYTGSARLHIVTAATFTQRVAEIDPGSPAATRASREYIAACDRLAALSAMRQP